jgi:hypothetical protein
MIILLRNERKYRYPHFLRQTRIQFMNQQLTSARRRWFLSPDQLERAAGVCRERPLDGAIQRGDDHPEHSAPGAHEAQPATAELAPEDKGHGTEPEQAKRAAEA